MNEILNNFLLAGGDQFMPEIHSKQTGFTVLADNLLKIKKEFKNLKKLEIQNIFPKMN